MTISKIKKNIEVLLEETIVPEEEQPFEVPENWVWTRIKSIIKTMETRDPKKLDDRVFHYIDVDAIDNKKQSIRQVKEIEIKVAPSRARRKVSKNDVIISLVRPYLKNIACIKEQDDKLVASTAFYVCTPNNSLNSKYLYYYLQTDYSTQYLINHTKGDNSPSVRNIDFEMMPIPLPPLIEQKRIVEKVELLLEKIDEAKQLIEEVGKSFVLRQSVILDKAFVGLLTGEWRNKNGVEFIWKEKKLKDIIKVGPQNGIYKPQSAYGLGTTIVRIDSFYNGKINEWKLLKRLQLEQKDKEIYGLSNDDILINRVNSIEYLGKSALVRNLIEPTVFESNIMRIKLNEKIIPEYLILYLNSSRGLKELRKNAKHAVNQASINQQDVKNVIVPLPTLEEQEMIVQLSRNLLEKNEKASNHNEILLVIDGIKKSILTRAFRSDLATNDPSNEKAIELLIESIRIS
ncbi:MAG: restriction endonuclease subunit S [Paenisporosarcina sp.]